MDIMDILEELEKDMDIYIEHHEDMSTREEKDREEELVKAECYKVVKKQIGFYKNKYKGGENK